jgi:hypothetical protein
MHTAASFGLLTALAAGIAWPAAAQTYGGEAYAPQPYGAAGYTAQPYAAYGGQPYAPPGYAYVQNPCGTCVAEPAQQPAPWTPPAPAQCFAKTLIPPVTESYSEQVLVAPGRTETVVQPGDTRIDRRTVLKREASVDLVDIPPTYRTVTETVVVNKATTRIEVVPAIYDTVTEQVKVRDGYEEWRPGVLTPGYNAAASYSAGASNASAYMEHNPAYGGLTTRELPTGGVLCLIKVPPEYKTVTKQVLRTPSRTVVIPVPEETQTITRQVVDQPAHVERRSVAAEYGAVDIQVKGPDRVGAVQIAPVYQTVTKTRVVMPTRFEWTPTQCVGQASVEPTYGPPPPPPPPPPPAYAAY